MLREDNADLRLTEVGRGLGLVGDERWRVFSDQQERIDGERERLETLRVGPSFDPRLTCSRGFDT